MIYDLRAVPPVPPLHPNEVQAIYMQMLNSGQNYVGRLGGPPITIEQWRDEQLTRSNQPALNPLDHEQTK